MLKLVFLIRCLYGLSRSCFLSGVCVGNDVEGLAPGIYVVRQGDKTAKMAIR